MNLRWCGAAGAADAATRLGVADPIYRAADATWWTVSAGAWKVWRGGAWHPAEPHDRVEGPAVAMPATERPQAPETPAADHGDLAPSISAAVEHVGAAYQAGWLTSDAAEAALNHLFLVDVDGGVWTVGVASARWYRYGDGAWQSQESAPDATKLLSAAQVGDDTLPAPVRDRLAAYLSADAPLPEPVTQPWSPPATTPAEWRPTHRVPTQGIAAYEAPGAAPQAIGSLAGGLYVEVLDRSGAWARVAVHGGTVCWVDGRLLTPL